MIYYVSTQRGNDSYNGTAQGTPFLTIGKAVSVVAAGDIVYIGPGVYREAVSILNSGTPTSPIRFIGDPDCGRLISDTPGIVHLTKYDSSWVAQAGVVLDCAARNNQQFWHLHIDGTTTTAVSSTGTVGIEFFKCSINAAICGITGVGVVSDSFISAGQTALLDIDSYRSIMIGGSKGADGGNHFNSVAIGGASGFYTSVCYGSQAIGSTNGFNACSSYNCVAYNCFYGFYGSSLDSIVSSCTGIGCNYGFYGTDVGNALVLTLTTGNMNVANTGGTVSGSVGACTAVSYNWFDMRRMLEPFLCAGASSIRATGNNSYTTTYDILYRERGLNNGTVSRGAYEVCDEGLSYATYTTTPPSVVMNRAAQTLFYIPVEAGKTINVSVDVKMLNTSIGAPPSIKLRNNNLEVLDTAISQVANGQWTTLTVTGTTDADTLFELMLCANDNVTSSAQTYFSNIKTAFTTVTAGIVYGAVNINSRVSITTFAESVPGGVGATIYLGNPVQISGRANWQFMKNGAAYKCAVTFVPTKTGTINRVGLSVRSTSTGYGAGDGGACSFELRQDGTGNLPSATKIGDTISNIIPGAEFDGLLFFDTPSNWVVTAGTRYHIVFWIPAGTASRYCSINTAAGELFPWPHGSYGLDTPRVSVVAPDDPYNGSWLPWTSNRSSYGSAWNITNDNTVNGSHSSLQIRYTDNSWEGSPYFNPMQSGAGSSGGSPVAIYGARRYGEYIVWPHANFVVEKIMTAFGRIGIPAGYLRYNIQNVSTGVILRQAYFAKVPSSFGIGYFETSTQSWDYGAAETWTEEAALSSSLTLVQGTAYRIYFDSPNSTSIGYYKHKIVYSLTDATSLANSFGSTACYSIFDTGSGAWSSSGNNYEATFLLRGHYA